MHIPDGFLSTPVWVTMGLASAPSIGYAARRASATLDERRVPLLGVMGAFVFAAQMINFPVGLGTSGHLVGGALLAMTVGPAAACIVMTAIVAVQALVFQDGGLLTLGANVFNMAVAGVAVGYLPFAVAQGRWPTAAAFAGGFLSVMVSAALALSELWASGLILPRSLLAVSIGLFAAAATAEGVVTVMALRAIEAIDPGWVRKPQADARRVVLAAGAASVALVTAGVFVASAAPDGLAFLARQAGFAVLEQPSLATPFAGYETSWLPGAWMRQATAGAVGLCLVFILSVAAARLLRRKA